MRRILTLAAALLGACTSNAPSADLPETGLAITVAPLRLPGVGRADYALSVSNAAGVVWQNDDLDTDRYGDGSGSLSYVGPCDASQPTHTVTLVLENLYEEDGTLIPASSYQNPTPLSVTATCVENADTPVVMNLTILRSANQGFFDVAVNFDDIFCSAKLDCEDDDGNDLDLLHRPNGGPRDLTVVLALACTGGPTADTNLYLDDVVVTCTDPSFDFSIDTSGGPGNVTPIGNSGGLAFAAAIYRGDEAQNGVSFWNVAVGLDESHFAAAGTCRLVTKATASDGALAGNTTPPDTAWPIIHWAVDLVSGGRRVCTRDPIDVEGSDVTTDYSPLGPGVTFGHGYENGGGTTTTPPPGCPGCSLSTFAPAALATATPTTVTLTGSFAAAGDCHDCELQLMPAATPLAATFDSAAGTIQFSAPAGSRDVTVRFVVGLDVVPLTGLEVDGSGRIVPFSHASLTLPRVPPVVTSASGCIDDEAPRALSCDVAGQPITIRGQSFGATAADITVTVGGVACTGVSVNAAGTTIGCNLPAGAGFDLDVTVTVAGRSATGLGLVSYFGPGVGAVTCTGCGAGGLITDQSKLTVTLAPPQMTLAGFTFALEHGPLAYPCTLVTFTPPMQLVCDPPDTGAGSNLALVIHAGSLVSRPSAATFRYPAPVIVAASLSPAVGSQNGGEWFTVDVANAPLDPSIIAVTYGPYPCAAVTATSAGAGLTRVGCLTVPGVGGPHAVTVTVDGQASAPSADGFTYPVIPTVTSVSGCVDSFPRTVDCPTAGGASLVVSGTSFASDAVVWLGDSPCPGSTRVSPTVLSCVLPAGTGDRAVTVRSGLIVSTPLADAVSYMAPLIEDVSGCTDLGPTTYGCQAGTTIAVSGHDFGPSPTITVGGVPCAPLTALGPGIPFDRGAKCQLPAGSGMNVEVRAFNGHVSAPAFLSYAP